MPNKGGNLGFPAFLNFPCPLFLCDTLSPMPELADKNPQKDALLGHLAAFMGAGGVSLRGARLIDELTIAPQFGAAIETVFGPDDGGHTHALGMAELAFMAIQWLYGAKPTAETAPEWLRHTGIDFSRVLV
jgi:hypothetical protein